MKKIRSEQVVLEVGILLKGLAAMVPPTLFFLGINAIAADTPQAATPRSSTEACLECHAEKGQTLKFKDGSNVSIAIDKSLWTSSIHGGQLTCSDCHREITGYPHPKQTIPDSRAYTIAKAGTCQRCHYAYYTRVLDSIHYKTLNGGETSAPTCVDCHGSHYIQDPKSPRIEVNRKCAKCHSDINEIYSKSVHGRALIEENNRDVPVCTDCHGAHAIADPRSAEAHVKSYEVCAQCHGDPARMRPYGLNPDVTKTYLEDFHGASNRLYSASKDKPVKAIATCTDCHGVHDITSLKKLSATSGREVAKERVVKACRKCHEQVPAGFADAWLSHYTPTWENAPLVWAVKVGYRVLIPLILAGLVLHILLHLWRLYSRR